MKRVNSRSFSQRHLSYPADKAKNKEAYSSKEVLQHDTFNIFVLIFIVVFDIFYLVQATDFSKMGTDRLGEGCERLAFALNFTFTGYLAVDCIWVALIPKCVSGNSTGIVIHHLLSLLLVSVPWTYKQFCWHAAINLVVESNTLFLILRRNCVYNGIAFKIYNVLFYVSWVSMRLIMYPILVVFFYLEYRRFSESINNPYNIVIFAAILQFLITAMSFKWTYDILRKHFQPKKRPIASEESSDPEQKGT